ncbi:CLUMA_CG009321, isoform A [Clunio marinus]|uniref:CLUMA_CG009321, isoform A n=1 Tax=Clunio marinus TaxID=568069 RepID=A0A1J1I810_9DIPT|nr:CLUMA_CG009321, isoform A [Clunio marinus]
MTLYVTFGSLFNSEPSITRPKRRQGKLILLITITIKTFLNIFETSKHYKAYSMYSQTSI